MSKRLSPMQARFVEEYMLDLNATQAAIRAGYSRHSAYQRGHELLRKEAVAAAIQEAKAARGRRTEITADRVLEELARIAFFDIRKIFRPDGTLCPVADLPEEVAAAIAGCDLVTVSKGEGIVEHVAKIKAAEKLGALTMLAKHLGLTPDRVKHEGTIEVKSEASKELDERLKELMSCIRKG